METTISELRESMAKKEDAYRAALDQMEIALITFKNRFLAALHRTNLCFSS